MKFFRSGARLSFCLLVTAGLLASCLNQPASNNLPTAASQQPVETKSTAVPTATSISPTPASTKSVTPQNTLRPTITVASHITKNTPEPTFGPAPTFAPVTQGIFSSAALPATGKNTPIDPTNVDRLTILREWGRGAIQHIAYHPLKNNLFVVSSIYGIATYDLSKPAKTPLWTPFNETFQHKGLSFSPDGNYLMVIGERDTPIYRFPDMFLVDKTPAYEWIKGPQVTEYENTNITSPDGKTRFTSLIESDPNIPFLDFPVMNVSEVESEKVLYSIKELPRLTIEERAQPEACDIGIEAACGNGLIDTAFSPYLTSFSPDGKTLAILFRPIGLGSGWNYSTLNIYNAQNGDELATIGSRERPVITFAYSPDGSKLVVGYVDGMVQAWDLSPANLVFESTDFNGTLYNLDLSPDGKLLILQYGHFVELRSILDNTLVASYPAIIYTLSPVENQMALGGSDGSIQLVNLADEKFVFNIQAHKNRILSLSFSADGQLLVSSGRDCKVEGWYAQTGKSWHLFQENSTQAVISGRTTRIFIYDTRFIPGTDQLFGYGSFSTVVAWNASSGQTNYMIHPKNSYYYEDTRDLNPQFPPFDKLNKQYSQFVLDGIYYDTRSGKPTGSTFSIESWPTGCQSYGPASSDGRLTFVAGNESNSGNVCIVDVQSRQVVRTLQVNKNIPVSKIGVSSDGSLLVIASGDGVIYLAKIAE